MADQTVPVLQSRGRVNGSIERQSEVDERLDLRYRMGRWHKLPLWFAPREASGCDNEVDPVVLFVVLWYHYQFWIPSTLVV